MSAPPPAEGAPAPGLSTRIGAAVAGACGARQKGGGDLYRTAVLEAAAVGEVVTESARAAADAARAAREAGYAGVQATAQAARDTLAKASQLLRRYSADASPGEQAKQRARDAKLQGLNLEAEAAKEEGNRLYGAKRYQEALEQYTRARALDPGRAAYASNTAAALLGLGRRRDAVQACCEAVALDPSFARPRQRLATICTCAASLEEALEVAMAMSDRQPNNAGLRDLVEHMAAALQARADGAALFARGRYREADELYTAAIERLSLLAGSDAAAPGIVLLFANRASAHCAQEMFSDALKDCDAACAIAPDEPALQERRTDVVRALNRASAFGHGQGRAVRQLGRGEQSATAGALL